MSRTILTPKELVVPASKARSVYNTLRHRILSGAYQPANDCG